MVLVRAVLAPTFLIIFLEKNLISIGAATLLLTVDKNQNKHSYKVDTSLRRIVVFGTEKA